MFDYQLKDGEVLFLEITSKITSRNPKVLLKNYGMMGAYQLLISFVNSKSEANSDILYKAINDTFVEYYAIHSFQIKTEETLRLEETLHEKERTILEMSEEVRSLTVAANFAKDTIGLCIVALFIGSLIGGFLF